MRRKAFLVGAFALACIVLVGGVMAHRANQRFWQLNDGMVAVKAGDGPTAVRKLEPLASSGDQRAQEILGWIYAVGLEGVRKNDEAAIRWFRLAGVHRHDLRAGEDPAAEQEYWMARAYAEGTDGADKNPTESGKWLERAARGRSRQAAELLRTRETPVAPCVTEEMLREANASEAEIRQFREEEAQATHEASCGSTE